MANEYLKRKPTSGGNEKVWTYSVWIKTNDLSNTNYLFGYYDEGASPTPRGTIQFNESNVDGKTTVGWNPTGSSWYQTRTEGDHRDCGNWFHLCIAVDTTKTDEGDGIKMYLNGAKESATNYLGTWGSGAAALNVNTGFNSLVQHYINAFSVSSGRGEVQYSDFFWVDGQALGPEVFGFYKDGDGYQSSGTIEATDFRPGQWSPRAPKSIKYTINRSGGFGANGFYLPMNDSSNPGADFHCAPNSIIKLKGEDLPQPRNGAPTTSDAYVSELRTDPFAANLILACPFVAGGFGQDGAVSSTIPGLGDYHIALGGPSSVPAVNWLIASGNQAKITGDNGLYYGSSLDVTTSSICPRATVGTAFTPDGDFTVEFWCYINSFNSGGTHIIQYDTDAGATGWLISADAGNLRWMLRNSSNQDVQVSIPNVVKTGQWTHIAGVYDSSKNSMTAYLNGVAVGTTAVVSNYLSTQYTNLNRLHIGSNGGNGSRPLEGYMSDLRIYKGVAKYKSGFDVPKPYTPVGIEPFRTSADTCKNNFATLNSIFGVGRQDQLTYTNGNLTVTSGATSGSDTTAVSTTAIKDKVYCEFYLPSDAIGAYVGAAKYNTPFAGGIDTTASSDCWLVRGDTGNKANGESGSGLSYGGAFSNGDIIMMAADIENGSIWWGRNGSWTASGNPATNSNAAYTNLPSTEDLLVICGDNYSDKVPSIHVNFGQNQTFANLKAVNKNRVNNGTGNDVWHQSSNGGNHVDWTASAGGTQLDVAVPNNNYARAWLLATDGTIDPKKTYLVSFDYVTGPANLGVQNDHGYMTAVDGSVSPNGLSSGNSYSFVVQGTREFNFTGFSGSTYSLQNIVVSEIDECYTDTSGKGKFHYEPPTGFLALCEDNLPTPAIADPGEHFKCVLYAGDDSAGRRINVGFQPDLIWFKSRNTAVSHVLIDSVRGLGHLNSNSGGGEGTTGTLYSTGYANNGFDLSDGANSGGNKSGRTYVAWCWKAGGPAVTNTEGNITTQVSANPEAGFSIVRSPGPGTSGHGLNSTPRFIIQKSIGTGNWNVAHADLYAPGGTGKILLNYTDPVVSSSTTYMHEATATTFDPLFSGDQIAYVWAEVEGFSKFGSYVGNGLDDGPMIVCGFKPAWLMVKRITTGGNEGWVIYDNVRGPYNPNAKGIYANSDIAENSAAGRYKDFLSNGFKIRGSSGEQNSSGITYIFAAFAESPVQTANAK